MAVLTHLVYNIINVLIYIYDVRSMRLDKNVSKETLVTRKKHFLWGQLSLVIGGIGTLFVLNFYLGITPNVPFYHLFIPFPIGIIGFVIGAIGLARYEDRISLYAVVYNFILAVSPLLYWPIGLLIFGP